MPTTTNILLSTPAHGTSVDTWDADPINNNSAILDAVAGSVTTKSLTNAPVTLSTTESRVNILRFSGTLSGNVLITLGAVIKSWVVENNTLGAFTITVQGSPGTGNAVGLPMGSCQIYWDGTNVSFINMQRVGDYWDCAAGSPPAWVAACTVPPYLHANGTTFSAVTYPQLNQFLGGNTLPDSRGRGRFTVNNGTGRITTAGSGINGDALSSAGGAENITLDITMIPAHAHGVNDPTHDHGVGGGTLGGTGSLGGTASPSPSQVSGVLAIDITPAATGISIQNAGGGLAHNNMPPAYIGGVTLIRAA